jgi:hypothetical protein
MSKNEDKPHPQGHRVRGRMISMPAVAEADDVLAARPANISGTTRRDTTTGPSYRRRESCPMMWAALFQQRPALEEGDYFKSAWLSSDSRRAIEQHGYVSMIDPSLPLCLHGQIEEARKLRSWGPLAEAVLRHGRPYIGVPRPKGWRRHAQRQCFRNAAIVCFKKQCTYVEGFAIGRIDGLLIHHAWVTNDGMHAIDPTWDDAPTSAYFGIAFSTKVVGQALTQRRTWGLLDPLDDKLLESTLGN